MQTVFENLFERTIGKAYGRAIRLTRNEADAEELVQEAGLLAFVHFSSYRQGTNFGAWFNKILTNCFLMTCRKRKRQLPCVDTGERLTDIVDGPGFCSDTSYRAHSVDHRPTLQQILDAMQCLSKEYQGVLSRYFLQGFSYQEISEQLNIPVGTVRSRLYRGRRLLQNMLW